MLVTRSPSSPLVPASADTRDLLVKIHPGVPVVAEIGGEIDFASAARLRETLLLVIRRHGPALFLDLQGVTFLDCSGINVLLATARRALLEGGRLRVVRPSARVWRVIKLLGLQDFLVGADEPPVHCGLPEQAAPGPGGRWDSSAGRGASRPQQGDGRQAPSRDHQPVRLPSTPDKEQEP